MPAENVSGIDEAAVEPDQPERGSKRRGGSGIWALLAVVLLVAIVLLILLTQCVPRVPDVVGLTEKQAEAKLVDTGYELGSVSKLEIPNASAGKVAEQAPPAGAVFARGRSVDLVVALGADMVEVPDVIGNDTPAAELLITGRQLVMKVDGRYDPTIPSGAIISQNPPAGTKVRTGSTVLVVVSLGIEPTIDTTSTSSGGTGTSTDAGSGDTGSGSSYASNCTASYPNASVWASGGDIYIRLTSGAGSRRLTSGSAWDSNPLLAPSGKYVVFTRGKSSGSGLTEIGRVCLTSFDVTILDLPLTSIAKASTVSYGIPVFAPSPTGTAPGSDWLVTPQYLAADPSSSPDIGGRLLVTNVPLDSTWVSWRVRYRPTGGIRLSRSSKAGNVKVTLMSVPGPAGTLNFNVYTGKYSQ